MIAKKMKIPPPGSIEEAINNSVVSIDEIIDVIRKNLA
jgi:hypothetical protein